MTATGVPRRRREAPLPYRFDRLLVESGPETAQHFHVANAAIRADHDLQQHLALETGALCLLGVIRGHLAEQTGWCDPAAGAIRSAADATALTRPDITSGARPHAHASSAPAACAAAAACGLWPRRGHHPHQQTNRLPSVRRG